MNSLWLLAALLGQTAGSADTLDRFIYPMARPLPPPEIVIDVKDSPASEAWAQRAASLARTWYPAVTAMLATEDWDAPSTLKLIFKEGIDAPAYASGGEITINAKWITEHPDDFGMVIHEMTHVVQSYPGSDKTPGWLVEGVADYIRWYRYEPEAPRPRVDKEKSKVTDAYRTTAAFLAWTASKYDMRLVPVLDRAMRKSEDPLPEFVRLTGKDHETLWKEFVATLP